MDAFASDFGSVTGLHLASYLGLPTLVRLLLQKGDDVNARAEDGATALHTAVRHGHHECARALIDHGAKTDVKDDDGRTALCAALKYAQFEFIKMLLVEEADVEVMFVLNADGTALHIAAEIGHHQCVEVLLKAGADISSQDDVERTALDLVTRNGNEELVKKLLEHEDVACPGRRRPIRFEHLVHALEYGYKNVVDLHLSWHKWTLQQRDEVGRTLLSHAAEWGYTRAVQVLLSCEDVEVNSVDKDGRTPLWWAAASYDGRGRNTTTQLANFGADVNITDVDKVTALHVAATNNFHSTVTQLLDSGADITTRDQRDLNALDMAILYCSHRSAMVLLAYGGRVSCGFDGMTALHMVAFNRWTDVYPSGRLTEKKGSVYHILMLDEPFPLASYWGNVSHRKYFDMIWLLMTNGFKLDACDKHKQTVLHYAVSRGVDTLVQVLLDERLLIGRHREAFINTLDESGRTALQLAASQGNTVIANLLLDEGASVRQRDCRGKTPRELAVEKGHDETAQVLEKLEKFEDDLYAEDSETLISSDEFELEAAGPLGKCLKTLDLSISSSTRPQ